MIKTYDYDAYGKEINPDPNDTNPFRYCGEYYDTESGQLYLRNRYYNSGIGRFITEDPIKDGLNWYVYCGGDPVNYVDISGLEYAKLTDLVNSTKELFKTNPKYIHNSWDTSVRINLGVSDGKYASGKFYYNGYADVPYNSGRSNRIELVGDNKNGSLYMTRENFYRVMGIKYKKETAYRTISENTTFNVLLSAGLDLISSKNEVAAKLLELFLKSVEEKLPPGEYKVEYIYAEVINYAADTQRYETLITVDSYRIGHDELGNPSTVLVDSSTKFLGRFEQSIIN